MTAGDRHLELANICAGHTANALARLLDCVLWVEPPRLWKLEPDGLPEVLFAEPPAAAVFADLSAAELSGPIGLALDATMLSGLLYALDVPQVLRGIEPDPRTSSALSELGNIAISAAANALSGVLGQAVLPSVPRIGLDLYGLPALEDVCGELPPGAAALYETSLRQQPQGLRINFLWVPEG